MHNGWHVGVVIPAKNEELFIGKVHKELKKPNLPKEAFKNFELIGQYKIDSKKISMKILGAVICTCIAGVTLLDIETAKYSAGQDGGVTPGAEATTD